MPVSGGLRKRDSKKQSTTNTAAPPDAAALTNHAPTPAPPFASASPSLPFTPSHHRHKPSTTATASFLPSLFAPPSPHLLLSPSTARLYGPLSLLTGLLVVALYAATLYPSVTGGDSGELIISACNFGVAHPPGYPTWVLLMGSAMRLGRLVWPGWWLGDFSPAWVVNMSNAVLGSVAAVLLYKTTALLTDNAWSGVMAAVGFACSPTVWLYSIQGEVFALNNLLCAAMAYLIVRYFESESRYLAFSPSSISASSSAAGAVAPSASTSSGVSFGHSSTARARSYLASHALLYAYLGAAVCGLAMTNQHTTVFYVLPSVLLVLYSLYTARLLSFTTLLTLGLLLALGMSPYLYLPIRAFFQPPDSWGDQRTIAGFLTHFLRQEYGTFQLAASDTSTDPGMWSRLLVYLKVTQDESLHLAPVLAVWGVVCMLRSGSRAVRLSVAVQLYGYVMYVVVFHKLANLDLRPLFLGVQARFWQQANMYVFIWAACGVQQLTRMFLPQQPNPTKASESSDPATTTTTSQERSWLHHSGSLLIAVVSLLYASAQVLIHYQRMDHSHSTQFIHNGRKILTAFPPDSLVLLNGDLNNNIIKYPQACEGLRPDVQLLSLQLMTWDWFVPMQRANYANVSFPGVRYHVNYDHSFTMRQFFDRNVRKFPIFLCGPWKDGDYSNVRTAQPLTKYYDDFPWGECARMLPATRPPKNLTRFIERGLEGLIRLRELPPFDSLRYGADSWEHVLYNDALQRLVYITSYTSYYSNQRQTDQPLLALAHQLTVELTQPDTLNALMVRSLMSAQDYRACGVIYGQWSKVMKDRGEKEEAERASAMMRDMWKIYVNMNPQDGEIKRTLDSRHNPYTGELFSSHLD